MPVRSVIAAFMVLFFFTASVYAGQPVFKLRLTNQSRFTTICTILGHDKTDSVRAGETKTILFPLEPEEVSFYLSCWTTDNAAGSYQSRMIRVLNEKNEKKIVITPGNQLSYLLTPAEKVIAEHRPRLMTKNFWRLDSIIAKQRNSIAAADIIYLSLCDIDVKTDTIQKYFQRLSPRVQASPYGKRIVNYITARGRLAVGNKVGDFNLADSSGNFVRLSDIKSDYVLLDFWFSRCQPCIASFPSLKQLYEGSVRTKLAIVGVSVDVASETALWKSMLRKYGLPWINLNDPKYKLAQYLAIVNYPTRVLLNKERKIVLLDTDNSQENFYKELERMIGSD